MNYIPGSKQKARPSSATLAFRGTPMLPVCVALLLVGACGAPASEQELEESQVETTTLVMRQAVTTTPEQEAQATETGRRSADTYQIEFVVTPDPAAKGATVELILDQNAGLLRELDMRAPAEQFSDASGDGFVSHDGERLVWQPPEAGGTLRYFVKINHARNGRSYDALMTKDWSIFRAEDIIPQAASRTRTGAKSETTLTFKLPPSWSSVTEYFGRNDRYLIQNPERRLDRPAGWILLGKIGIRNDTIAGVNVKVAAPVGQGFRRMDILALLGWTLPEIARIYPNLPDRLTIIGASDPMWRGGLSGPRSLFVHADRPLLSENATSTILHEVMHVALGKRPGKRADWIVEGLAEYYSLLVLSRTGTISEKRFTASLAKLEQWGREADQLCVANSRGPSTAKAVTVFASLDQEIRRRSRNKSDLDDVIRALAASDENITIPRLIAAATEILESVPQSLNAEKLPGCEL